MPKIETFPFDPLSDPALRPVHPSRDLRPGSKKFMHVLRPGGQEFIIIKGSTPYGSLTSTANSEDAAAAHLLHVTESSPEATTFELYDDLLGLQAATFGSKDRLDLLESVYGHVKEAVNDISRLARVERIGIGDFVVNHTDGAVYLLPPVNFHQGESNSQQLLEHLATDIEGRYQGALGSRSTTAIAQSLRKV